MADAARMTIRVPKDQRNGLTRLIGLSDHEVSELHRALQAASPALDAAGIVAQLGDQVSIPLSDVAEIVALLFSLAFTRVRLERKTEQLVADVAQAAVQEGLLEKSSAAQQSFAERLSLLLSVEKAIGVSSKAVDVLYRHKNSFVSARVVSDIRTVFSETPAPTPVAAVIVHSLEVASHTDDEHISHYVALDGADLRALKRVIERAIQKEAALRQTIEHLGMSYIDTSTQR